MYPKNSSELERLSRPVVSVRFEDARLKHLAWCEASPGPARAELVCVLSDFSYFLLDKRAKWVTNWKTGEPVIVKNKSRFRKWVQVLMVHFNLASIEVDERVYRLFVSALNSGHPLSLRRALAVLVANL
jgi:hypothetical protein